MLEVGEALAEVLRHVKPLGSVETPLSPAVLGRVLAADMRADSDAPPFDKSLRDGYAVRAADCAVEQPVLREKCEIAAGAIPTIALGRGECARIFTGAPMPVGADAVVMQEETELLDGGRIRITDASVKPGQWVFARGTEMRAGDVVLRAGTVINPAAHGVLASLGMTRAPLVAEPRVSVLSTGNELVEPGMHMPPGSIRNSNGPMLSAQVLSAGGRPTSMGIVRDDRACAATIFQAALSTADLFVVAGGVSVGKFDLVPAILEEQGVTIHFRQVRMKPGKPLLFGTRGNTLVFGLPGNPVSAFVGFELFVRPVLRALQGHTEPGPTTTELPLAEAIAMTNDRPTFHPAQLDLGASGYSVRPLPWLGAPDLRGLQPAGALMVLQPGVTRLEAGATVPVVLLR